MTNEEAIKIFKSELDWAEQNRYPYISENKVKAIKLAIKALEQPRWIPVSERLPEDRQRCIVTVQGDSKTFIDIVTYYAEEHSFLYYEECNVLAWMPLPEPYREGDNDAEH